MTDRPKTDADVLAGCIGQLAAAVVTLSHAVEDLAGEPDEAARRRVADQARHVRAAIAEWGPAPPDAKPA